MPQHKRHRIVPESSPWAAHLRDLYRLGHCWVSPKVEASIGRWKQVIGDGLRSRIDERRMTEVNVAVDVLNRMLELGRPNYVRIV
jgi:hypothetical protein